MSNCVVCEKAVPGNSTHCSVRCLNQAQAASMDKRSQARSKFVESFNKMYQSGVDGNSVADKKVVETNMIVIRHRWKRNKVESVGSTIIAFDANGFARIPNVGNNILDVEKYVSRFSTLTSFVENPNVVNVEIPSEAEVVAELVKASPLPVEEAKTESIAVIEEIKPLIKEEVTPVRQYPTPKNLAPIVEPEKIVLEEDIESNAILNVKGFIRRPGRPRKNK
jgi:hypothetical protein